MRYTRISKDRQAIIIDDNEGAVRKLTMLENVEEELGNNLIKLFKALEPNQHIWSIGNFEGVKCYVGDKYLTEYKEIIAYSGNKDNFVICRLCDYGKTWAFTKEELKNDLR